MMVEESIYQNHNKMFLYIDSKSREVREARNKREAGKQLGMSCKQSENFISWFDPHNDKDAIIPDDLIEKVEAFTDEMFTREVL